MKKILIIKHFVVATLQHQNGEFLSVTLALEIQIRYVPQVLGVIEGLVVTTISSHVNQASLMVTR